MSIQNGIKSLFYMRLEIEMSFLSLDTLLAITTHAPSAAPVPSVRREGHPHSA